VGGEVEVETWTKLSTFSTAFSPTTVVPPLPLHPHQRVVVVLWVVMTAV